MRTLLFKKLSHLNKVYKKYQSKMCTIFPETLTERTLCYSSISRRFRGEVGELAILLFLSFLPFAFLSDANSPSLATPTPAPAWKYELRIFSNVLIFRTSLLAVFMYAENQSWSSFEFCAPCFNVGYVMSSSALY